MFDRVLNMPLPLNIPGFWICLSNSWICLMSQYTGIYVNMPKSAWMTFVLHFPIVIPCQPERVVTVSMFTRKWKLLIPLRKSNLNLPVCSFFSCLMLGRALSSCCHAGLLAALRWVFSLFYQSRFCSPAINETFLSQSRGWFSFIIKHFLLIGKLIWLDKNNF